jgi:hypothetical protein
MTRLANLQSRVLKHASDQLDRLVATPRQPSCGLAGDRAAVMRLEALIARHVREFGWLGRLHLDPDATPYEIAYAARRWFERPNRPAAQLRIRDLVGVPVGRTR